MWFQITPCSHVFFAGKLKNIPNENHDNIVIWLKFLLKFFLKTAAIVLLFEYVTLLKKMLKLQCSYDFFCRQFQKKALNNHVSSVFLILFVLFYAQKNVQHTIVI